MQTQTQMQTQVQPQVQVQPQSQTQIQTYHFDEEVNDKGEVTLSGLPPLAQVVIVVIDPEPAPDPFDWKKEMDAWMLEMQDHPFAKMSREEVLAKLRQTREDVYDEVYGHRHAN